MTRSQIKQSLQIGFTYIGTVVGAGFASGQEILQFFTVYGTMGYLGIVIAMCLFAWVGIRILTLGYELRAKSYRDLNNYLFGRRLASIIDIFMMVMLFGVTVAMLAGVGALFQENLRIPFQIGVLFTMLITFLTILHGMKGILYANSIIVPLMLTLISIVFIKSAIGPLHPNPSTSNTSLTWQGLVSAISYAALNLGLAVSVLVPLGDEIRDKKVLRVGAICGAVGLGLMLLGAQYAMLQRAPQIWEYEVPMAYITSTYGPFLKFTFLLVLWGEIYTTLIANVYGLNSQLNAPRSSLQGSFITVLILTTAFFISQIGFSNIVTYLYPIFGYLSFLLLLLLMWPRKEGPLIRY